MNLLDDFSFREKSLLISLLAVLFAYGGYFARMLGGDVEPTLSGMLVASIGVIIVLVLVQIGLHTVLAIIDKDEAMAQADERDLLVASRAARFSHLVLSCAVAVVIGRILIYGAIDESAQVVEVSLYEVANLLLFAVVVSEVVNYATQLYFYRRGIQG